MREVAAVVYPYVKPKPLFQINKKQWFLLLRSHEKPVTTGNYNRKVYFRLLLPWVDIRPESIKSKTENVINFIRSVEAGGISNAFIVLLQNKIYLYIFRLIIFWSLSNLRFHTKMVKFYGATSPAIMAICQSYSWHHKREHNTKVL